MVRARRGVIVFLILTFVITWALAFGVGAIADKTSTTWNLFTTVLMAMPALCALFVREFIENVGLRGTGLRGGRGRYYLYAWLLPPLFALIAMGLSLLLQQAEFDRWATELMVRIKLTYPDMSLDPNAARLGLIVFTFTLGMIPLFITGFITEFAWRGYLLMRLLPCMKPGYAVALTGLIAGVWYAPFILLPNRHTPYFYPDHPWLGVLLMAGFSTISGVLLGWLRLASRSLFPAAVGAAAISGPAQTALFFLRNRNDLTTGLTGLIGQAVMLLFLVGLWRSGALHTSYREGEEDARDSLPE